MKKEIGIGRKKIEDYSYNLSSLIGKGYSSEVYRGRHDTTEQQVAIKVIDLRMLKGEVHKNLLSSQIDALKTLKRTPHIIDLYNVYTTKNNTYIITQLCDDGDLSKTIKKNINESQAISIMKQIILGYTQLYKNGLIHRDLKPANIFLKNGQVKIADFGFAMKAIDGSPIYMPPQSLNQNKYSFKSDIWALGVIFYELLTGKTPWKAKTQKQLGKLLTSLSISRLMPKNIQQSSINFLNRTLEVDYNRRMCPQELIRFIFEENNEKDCSKKQFYDTSLTRNSINTPKHLPQFNFKSCEDQKHNSLPKTAATIAKTENHLQKSSNLTNAEKKNISKHLLTQIHFCRFLYKLLKRIDDCNIYKISSQLKQLMWRMIFMKLDQVKTLKLLQQRVSKQYEASTDYQKIFVIVEQYQNKYWKQLTYKPSQLLQLEQFQQELEFQILKIHQEIQLEENIHHAKEEIIILDYFVTLRQLISLMATHNLQGFHTKSKMQAIVEGEPAVDISKQHFKAITNKLKAIQLI